MLTATDTWMRLARSGRANPLLLAEISPTVLYDERTFNSDWEAAPSMSSLDPSHPTGELRLEETSMTHQEKQLSQTTPWRFGIAPAVMQVFSSNQAFRLKKLYVGLYNPYLWNGTTKVSIVRDVRLEYTKQGMNDSFVITSLWKGSSLFGPIGISQADIGETGGISSEEIASITIDHSLDAEANKENGPQEGTDYLVGSSGEYYRVLDFSKMNVWIPGGDTPCAIIVAPDISLDKYNIDTAEFLSRQSMIIRTSTSPPTNGGGMLVQNANNEWYLAKDWHTEGYPQVYLSFYVEMFAYAAAGSAYFYFDADGSTAGLSGELELKYNAPPGTSLSFQKWEQSSGPYISPPSGSGTACADGSVLSNRYVCLKVLFSSPSQFDTPRVYSLRIAFKRVHRFVTGPDPVFYGGKSCPNIVAEPPSLSLDGNPLTGENRSPDSSQVVFTDAGDISRIFNNYSLKNDMIRLYLGFASPDFGDGDWLPFKVIWIEDWLPAGGKLAVMCYDQMSRFKTAQIPQPNDPPELNLDIWS